MNNPNPTPALPIGKPPMEREKALPTGTVTFLFTDIQGSTPLWERAPQKMAEALKIHNAALRQAFEANGGLVFKTVGDAFQAAFSSAPQALKAAIEGQRLLQSAAWNELGLLAVRMGLHTGEAELDPGGDEYAVSHTKNRIGRIHSVAYGDQILLSQETADLVLRTLPEGVSLKDLGEHRLKGMQWTEPLFQVCAPGLPSSFPPLATEIIQPNNLPVQMTSFIGREREITAVYSLLADHRLVTLTGSGGTGKTRLSLKAAEKLLGLYPDGIWFVELAPVTDPALLSQTAAFTLGLKARGSQPIGEILVEYLSGKQALLVFDNCEHLIEACAILVNKLLQSCSKLKILASSREALGVAGEIPFHVPSMTLPDPHNLPVLADIGQFEAVRLFTERAGMVYPGFQVTADNAQVITQVCQRLDGIPLAIELAAARLNVLTPGQLASRLDDAFRLLTGGARTALPRQQTLRAAIDWSYQLLSEAEKKLLRRMAVFAGSFDLPAVEAVCGLDENERIEALDVLSSLVRKSILTVEQQPGPQARYRLLETVRQYAREKLNYSGESQQLHELHSVYYLDMARQAGLFIFGQHAASWLMRLDVDFPNLRLAFSWVLGGQSLEKAITALVGLEYYFLSRGLIAEGRDWLEKYLDRVDSVHPSLARAGLLRGLGFIQMLQGWIESAHESLTLGRDMSKELGDRLGYARATMWLGTFPGIDLEASLAWKMSVSYFKESAAIFKELGDEQNLAFTIWLWGISSRNYGDLESAQPLLEESERLFRKISSWWVAEVDFNLAELYYRKGHPEQARRLFLQALPRLQELDDLWGQMYTYHFMGEMERSEAIDRPGLRKAEGILLECLEIARKFGNEFRFSHSTPISLAEISYKLGDYALAIKRYREALLIIQGFGPEQKRGLPEIGQCLLGLANTTACLGTAAISARLLGALEGLHDSKMDLWKNFASADFARIVETTRAALGEEQMTKLYAEGQAMTLEQAVAFALEEHE